MPLGRVTRAIRRGLRGVRLGLRPAQLLVVALLLAAGLSAAAAVVVTERGDQRTRRQAWADRAATALSDEVASAGGALTGARGLFAASPGGVGPVAFDRFAAVELETVRTQSLNWAPRVSASARAGFERASGRPIQEVGPGGGIRPAGARREYFPLALVAPDTALARGALGVDAASSPELRGSLAAARDGGAPVMTSALPLDGPRPSGVALVAAVYGPDPQPTSTQARRAGLRGYVGGVFSISRLVGSALTLLPAHSRLQIVSTGGQVFDSGHGAMSGAVGQARVRDSDWTVRVALTQGQPLGALPVALLVGGSVAMALLVGVLFAQANQRRREREHVHELLQQEADTDGLTGLFNRRRLERDLEVSIEVASVGHPLALMLLDLNGFKGYNDRFGHPAGDALLVRISARLVAAVPAARVYRLGGDEFCVLGPLAPSALRAATAAARDALTQRGEGFAISAAHGIALVPADATTPDGVMLVADARMYARKTLGRQSAGSQSVDVLVRALAERSSGLGEHVSGVAGLADRVGRRLGLDDPERGRVRRAALLHDIGKIAIPDSILDKRGSLDPGERDFVRRHTLIGERILRAAPALEPIAPLVRSSHERWDGTGYPDGLAGEEIPLGARIVFVCDAFEAMTSPRRPHHAAVSRDEALAELLACAGSQFDPRVVRAVTEIVRDDPRPEEPAEAVPVGSPSTSRRAPGRRG